MAEIRGLTKADFDFIVTVMDRWWGGPSGERAHPIFFYELGQNALVAEDDGSVVGFLLGFVAPTDPPLGYVHLVGIHPDFRRRGVGKQLYERFIERCRVGRAKNLKAITSVGNQGSVDFHRALGFTVTEEPEYAGPGRGRIVFTKAL
jgi:ribosomal protein S18 acetylase RimI-like enzyme